MQRPGTAAALVAGCLVLAGCSRLAPDVRPGAGPSVAAGAPTPAARYAAFALDLCDQTESRLSELSQLAETIADRHLAGGRIGVIWEPPCATGPQGPQYEIRGRSGGFSALDIRLEKMLDEADRSRDTAITGWQRAPGTNDLAILKRYREKFFVIAFGPRNLPALSDFVPLCDAWVDTGLGTDDRGVVLSNGGRAGQGNALANALNAWAFQAELVAALTRRGKMPTLMKSHMWADSKDWNDRYRGKMLFHDDLTVPPVAPGVLSRRYLDHIRGLIRIFAQTQGRPVARAADLIVAELDQGRRTVVAQEGHTTYEVTGQYEDAVWAAPVVLYDTIGRIKQYPELTPDRALVLRLGYIGLQDKLAELMRQKRQRILLITSAHDTRPEFKIPADVRVVMDTGWEFGDACVTIEGYPIRVFPPSGVMQLVAYESVNVEVLERLARRTAKAPGR